MKRIPALLLVLFVLIACGLSAWMVLRESPTPAPSTTPSVTVTDAGDESEETTDAATADDGGRRRISAEAAGETPQSAPNTVTGRVFYGDAGVAGARIEAYATPGGDYDEDLERARQVFGDLFTREELEALEGRFGGFGGMRDRAPADRTAIETTDDAEEGGMTVSIELGPGGASAEGSGLDEDQMGEAMNAGMELVGRMMSDPGFLEKTLDFARVEMAGFESDADWPLVGRATSGADGRFTLEDLPDGIVELRITAEGFRRHKQRVQVGSNLVDVQLAPGAVLAGTVTSRGQPVAGASVRTKTVTLTTDGAGAFRFDGAVTPKESLLVSASGYVTAGLQVEASADGELPPVTIELKPSATVRGVVLDASGAPVAGAAVRTSKGGGFNPMMFMELAQRDRVTAPAPFTVTDASGRFVLDGLASSSFVVRAEAQGYLPASSEALAPQEGEEIDGIELVLRRESVVVGRVTGPDGAPVADATVKVSLPAPEGMGAMIAGMFGGSWQTGRTASDGTFRVGRLTAGDRKIRVESSRFLHAESEIVVPEEDTVTHDVSLQPGYSVAGLVVSPTGAPVVDAKVTVEWKKEGGGNPMAAFMGGMGDSPDATARTNAEGVFTFDGLQEGPYTITADSSDYLDTSVEDIVPGTTDIVLQLRAASRISGVATDENGKPLGGVWVHLDGGRRRGGMNPMMAMFTQGPRELTDAQGRFTHSDLEPGKYTVFARRKGWAESERLTLELADGEVADNVTIALRAGATLSGVVLTRGTGEPVAGALVYVPENTGPMSGFNPMDAIDGPPTAPPNSISTNTDDDGRFQLEGLTPGKVTVEVRSELRAPASLASVTVPGADVQVEMGQGGVVEGYVLAAGGVPQAGVSIILSGGAMGFGRQRTTQTDADGFYRMDRIVPGTYQIMKMDGGSAFGVGGMNAVTVRESETLRKDFKPESTGGAVSGAVTRDGEPLSGAMVILTGGSVGMRMGTTEADGSFDFDSVPPGEYTVSVQSNMMGGGTTSETVTVEQGGKVTGVRLTVSSLKITGRVLDADTGEGVAMAQVLLFDPAMGPATSLEEIMTNQRGQAFTDAQGRFTLTGVEAGTFSMRVAVSGYAEATQNGVAAPLEGLEIRLSRGAEFEVTVLGPDGAPVSGATVVARDPSGVETNAFSMAMQGVTDSRGIATLRLAPGRHVIVAESGELPSSSVEVDAGAGSTTVRLEQGGSLDVVVRRNGQPVPGVRVDVLDEAGQPIVKRISVGNILGSGGATDAAGRIVRDGLPAGPVTVVVTPSDGAPTRREASVTRGGTERVEVELD